MECQCGCGGIFFARDKCYRVRQFISGHNSVGDKNPMWKGGRRYNDRGYVLIWKPEHQYADCLGYVYEHRLNYEEYHKCCILPWGHIHHINGIKSDNNGENLQLLTNNEHIKLHYHMKKLTT